MKEFENTWVNQLPSNILDHIERIIIRDNRKKHDIVMKLLSSEIKSLTYPLINNSFYDCDELQIRMSGPFYDRSLWTVSQRLKYQIKS